jgi:hypothetical protein
MDVELSESGLFEFGTWFGRSFVFCGGFSRHVRGCVSGRGVSEV